MKLVHIYNATVWVQYGMSFSTSSSRESIGDKIQDSKQNQMCRCPISVDSLFLTHLKDGSNTTEMPLVYYRYKIPCLFSRAVSISKLVLFDKRVMTFLGVCLLPGLPKFCLVEHHQHGIG